MVFAFPGIMVCIAGTFSISFKPSGDMIVITPPKGASVLFFSVKGIETKSSVATSTGIFVLIAKGNCEKKFFSTLPTIPSLPIPSTVVRKEVISSDA